MATSSNSSTSAIIAILSLYQMCIETLEIFKSGFSDSRPKISVDFGKILIQQGRFVAWGKAWDTASYRDRSNRLEKALLRQANLAPQIITALVGIAETFVDLERLTSLYGIEIRTSGDGLVKLRSLALDRLSLDSIPTESEVRQKIKDRKTRLEYLKQATFCLVDRTKFVRLTANVKGHVDDLLALCAPPVATSIRRNMRLEALKFCTDPHDLAALCDAAREEAKAARKLGQYYKGYEGLATAARIKSRMSDFTMAHVSSRLVPIDNYEYHRSWQIGKHDAVLSVCHDYGRIEYIEWKSYHNASEATRSAKKKELERAINLLATERHPPQFKALEFLFYFDDPESWRYGFVYQLPEYIRKYKPPTSTPSVRESQIASRCKPTSLTDILTEAESENFDGDVLELGARFRLAKQLIGSLHWMHTSGWTHRNIRASNILFFPEKSQHGLWPTEQMPQPLDFENPYLMGIGNDISDEEKKLLTRPRTRSNSPKTTAAAYLLRDKYEHPGRSRCAEDEYFPAFDIYALGLVLLEIGLWQQIGSFQRPEDTPLSFRRRMVEVEVRHLRGQCGAVYADVVKRCLGVEVTGCWEDSMEVLGYGIAARLDECRA
ncbi:hypothetical protein MMC25_005893 [Agyrium rufum]|nr:hypothetical protein [Agyrium rufum]